MRALASLLLGAAVCTQAACTQPDVEQRPPVALSLQFVARQSCGRISALAYDTSCLAALYVRVLDAARTPLYERCIDLANPPTDLGELLQGEPLLQFADLSTQGSVVFEVRGFHRTGLTPAETASLCDRPAQDDHWLFWGQSELVDLAAWDHSDAGSALIPVVVDCRDCSESCAEGECFGCIAMSAAVDAVCPAEFPPSVCAPASALMCAIPCDDDGDCFDGARRCIDRVCDDSYTGGTLCSRCEDGGPPCSSGLSCVARPGQAQGVCAAPCPDNTCVTGTRCTRIGNDLVEIEAQGQ